MPSLVAVACTSIPYRSRAARSMASAQGVSTPEPSGECTQTRQSPSSSRNRSNTTVVSVGRAAGRRRAARRGRTDQVAGRELVETGLAQPGAWPRSGRRAPTSRTNPPKARPSSSGRRWRVALPEREPARRARSGGDQHLVVGDLLDPPARGAEGEDVADPGLVDHLLVELADPAAGACRPEALPSPTRKTPNSPRSGMVPPEVTASRWAPGRAVSTPVSRCQTSRGRSSAKSSEG